MPWWSCNSNQWNETDARRIRRKLSKARPHQKRLNEPDHSSRIWGVYIKFDATSYRDSGRIFSFGHPRAVSISNRNKKISRSEVMTTNFQWQILPPHNHPFLTSISSKRICCLLPLSFLSISPERVSSILMDRDHTQKTNTVHRHIFRSKFI